MVELFGENLPIVVTDKHSTHHFFAGSRFFYGLETSSKKFICCSRVCCFHGPRPSHVFLVRFGSSVERLDVDNLGLVFFFFNFDLLILLLVLFAYRDK